MSSNIVRAIYDHYFDEAEYYMTADIMLLEMIIRASHDDANSFIARYHRLSCSFLAAARRCLWP